MVLEQNQIRKKKCKTGQLKWKKEIKRSTLIFGYEWSWLLLSSDLIDPGVWM